MELLTISEVCNFFKVSKPTFYVIASEYGFPKPFKVGRIIRYNRKELEDWVEQKRQLVV